MPSRSTVTKARGLRRTMTPPELAMWQLLRARPDGRKFRRQHPIGPYVLDFYCAAARLAIEVDGMAHDTGDRPERDARRDRWLAAQGIDTLRLTACSVLADPEAALIAILGRCASPLHQPAARPPPHAMHGED